MMAVLRKKDDGFFESADEQSDEVLKKLKPNEMFFVKLWKPRNLPHHRKFFALINLVCKHKPEFSTDSLIQIVKIGTGHFDVVDLGNDLIYRIPKSISFAAMDNFEFDQFYKNAVLFICEKILPMSSHVLEQEILRIVAEPKK